MPYRLELTKRFKRAYRKKTGEQQQQVDDALDLLVQDPRHPSLNSHYIVRKTKIWECYTNDALRVTFEHKADEPDVIICRNNCAHDATLRNP